MRSISVEERRDRLARRHSLIGKTGDVTSLARQLAGLHSTDPVTVFLAAAARRAAAGVDDVERALYEERTILRMLGMRRTLFVVPVELVSTVQRAYTDGFVARERKRLAGWLESAGITASGEAHIERMIEDTLGLLADMGEASTRELTTRLPQLDERFTPPVGTQTGVLSVGSRIVLLMTASGVIARTRPLGTWISSQYRYAPMTAWLGNRIPELEPGQARAQLAEAWLGASGPGTVTDLQWWTGWNLGQTREALRSVGAVEVEIESGTGFVLPDDIEVEDPVGPWAALLPALDSTPMGWKQRDWYLGSHAPRLFDRNGNVGPTVWWNGRVVGGWAQRRDGEIVVEFLEDVPDEARQLVDAQVSHLVDFIGDTRFSTRFRTPLERELVAR